MKYLSRSRPSGILGRQEGLIFGLVGASVTNVREFMNSGKYINNTNKILGYQFNDDYKALHESCSRGNSSFDDTDLNLKTAE